MIQLDAILVLEDGRAFYGQSVGARGRAFGEIVFNTSSTGYQEIASDPSYCGQVVVLTAPQVGNYGVVPADDQAPAPALSGLVIRDLSAVVSNWRQAQSLQHWLEQHRVVGISEVDTRALTRHIRSRGAMRVGIYCDVDVGAPVDGPAVVAPGLLGELRELVCTSPMLDSRDLTAEVTTKRWQSHRPKESVCYHVVVIDYGVKWGIISALLERGIAIDVAPADATAAEVLARDPDGIVLSNGPGDPARVTQGVVTARELVGELPLLGICMGHQVLARAVGARTFKLPFGHHGGNHPVKDLMTGEVWITAQNHGYAVDPVTLPNEIESTHVSLYDRTLEGFCWPGRRLMTVQFHPEACPGPSDARVVFDRYLQLLEQSSRRKGRR
jgi:carbamoyl-phosphate synthase small subunit